MKKIVALLVMGVMLLSVPLISSASDSPWENVKSNVDFSQLNLPANFTFAENNAIQLKDGRVMVIGTKNSYIYDSKTEKWSTAAPVTQKGNVYSPVLLRDGRVMVFTETDAKDGSLIEQAEIYNPTSNKWTLTSKLKTPRLPGVNAVRMQDGRVMVAGGSNGEGNDVEIYNSLTNTWAKAADMNHKARSGVTLLLLNDGRILATGGSVLTDGDSSNSKSTVALETYDPKKNQWTVKNVNGQMGTASKLILLADGSILFIGETRTGILNLKDLKLKTITSSGLIATDGLQLSDGRLLITGADANMTKGKAYLYTVGTGELVEITIPTTRPLLFPIANDEVLALGTANRVGESGFAWKWDKLYHYSSPGLFLDLPKGYWAENEIKYLVNLNIIKGIGNGQFGTHSQVTRAEGAAMLARSLYLNLNNRPNPGFKDLSNSHWAYKEVAALVDEGILPKDTNFQPNTPLTREEMAQLLVNAYKLKGEADLQFKDISKDYWAYDYINKLAANQITSGYPDGTFGPKNTVTRSEFSVFIARALDEKFRK